MKPRIVLSTLLAAVFALAIPARSRGGEPDRSPPASTEVGRPGARAADAPPLPSASARAPLRASWVVKTERAGEVVLVARVETFGHFRSPISVDLRMPEGVALVAGVPSVVLPPADAGAVREIELTFRFRSTPKEDLILVVDSQTPAAGVHAEDHYRFGRPAPERLQPAANGPAIRVGNLDFGRSVAVPPRDPAVAR